MHSSQTDASHNTAQHYTDPGQAERVLERKGQAERRELGVEWTSRKRRKRMAEREREVDRWGSFWQGELEELGWQGGMEKVRLD